MKFSTQIKSISHIKANAAGVIKEITESREPVVITQNGEAQAVLLDVQSYEEIQECMALLKILAIGTREVEEGKITPAAEVFKSIRKKKKRVA